MTTTQSTNVSITVTDDTDLMLTYAPRKQNEEVWLEVIDHDESLFLAFNGPGAVARLRQLAVDILRLTAPVAGVAAAALINHPSSGIIPPRTPHLRPVNDDD
jgi:hypothetical protein